MTLVPATNRDPNMLDLSQYKGVIVRCNQCKPEATLLGASCQTCMSQGYVAMCLNCNGTGKQTAPAVWDRGKSSHTSVCSVCGGRGLFPAREREYLAQPEDDRRAYEQGERPLPEFPQVVKSMTNLQPVRSRQ